MSKTSDYLKRRKQLSDGNYVIPDGRLCDYGCGLSAHFILMGKDRVERFCCSHSYLSCPAKKFVGSLPRYVDLAGQTFNYLTAIKPIGQTKQGSMKWLCRCSCSKEVEAPAGDLLRGRVKSCGHIFYHGKCRTKEYMLYYAAKRRARDRDLPFTIEPSDIVIPKVCPILGIPIICSSKKMSDNSPSLDRVYPQRGYVKGNIVVVSFKANRIKNACSPDDLIEIATRFKGLIE